MGTRFDQYPYGAVAFFYDELAEFYSRGRIGASKRVCLETIRHGDRVLFAGAGRGEEALLAAERGARVTAVDLAPSMLSRLKKRFEAAGLEAECLLADVAHLDAVGGTASGYDVVVANYFLNLFDLDRAEAMLQRLAPWVAPGGRLVIADFARPSGGSWSRLVNELYYRPVNWVAWGLGLCALHPIADYRPMLARAGFRVCASSRFPVFAAGAAPAFMALIAERDSAET